MASKKAGNGVRKKKIINGREHTEILNSKSTENETSIAVNKLKPSKAPRADGILGNFMLSTKTIIVPYSQNCLNKSLFVESAQKHGHTILFVLYINLDLQMM